MLQNHLVRPKNSSFKNPGLKPSYQQFTHSIRLVEQTQYRDNGVGKYFHIREFSRPGPSTDVCSGVSARLTLLTMTSHKKTNGGKRNQTERMIPKPRDTKTILLDKENMVYTQIWMLLSFYSDRNRPFVTTQINLEDM